MYQEEYQIVARPLCGNGSLKLESFNKIHRKYKKKLRGKLSLIIVNYLLTNQNLIKSDNEYCWFKETITELTCRLKVTGPPSP